MVYSGVVSWLIVFIQEKNEEIHSEQSIQKYQQLKKKYKTTTINDRYLLFFVT